MKVPAAIAKMAAEQGGVLEGDASGGTWWRDGLRGTPTLTWKRKRDGSVTINCTPTKPE